MVDRFKEPHNLPSLCIKKSKRTANYNNKSKEKKGTAVTVKLYLLFQSHEDENKYQSINQSNFPSPHVMIHQIQKFSKK